ncbi:MAG TPA: RNA polymerase sigma factor [Mycobacteriales bacterium]|nr:RNA polymerase sigma factor [Mycobacteriales bacterium]
MPRSAQRGVDDDAFGDVVRRETTVVFGFILRRVGDRSLTEDLTQETFLRAWRARRQFRGEDTQGEGSSMRGWLCSIAANVVRDHARRERRRPTEVREPEHGDIPVGGDLGDRVVQAEALDRLREALTALPVRQREMFLLRERDGLTYKEIAAALECPIGTVMSGLARARERLAAAVLG